MKVLLYYDNPKRIALSGIGTALQHQQKALTLANVEYTLNPKDDFDIAHINTYFPKSKRVLKKCLKKNIPVIVHGHSTIEDFKNALKGWKIMALWFNPNLIWFYKHANHIIAPTEYAKRLILSYNSNANIDVVSNGIELDLFKKNINAIDKFKKCFNIANEKVVISVGFPFQRKGILDFIKIAEKFPDIKFIWFGHLNNCLIQTKVKKAIKKSTKNCIFPGYYKQEILLGAYQYSKCVLFPSYEETEGIVTLEALASGTPLLIRDIPVYNTRFIDNQNCYKAHNIDEFITKLEYILNNDNSQMTKCGLDTIKEVDLKIIGNQLKDIYQKILKK